jgi:hypothetical protein
VASEPVEPVASLPEPVALLAVDEASEVTGEVCETEGPVVEGEQIASDVAPALAARGRTVCRVTGSNVSAGGRLHRIGDVAEFDNADVRSLPEFLVPV